MFCNVDYSTNHTLHGMYCYAIPNLAGGKIITVITASESVMANFNSINAKYTLSTTRIAVTLITTEHASNVTNIGIYCCYQTDPTKGQAMVSGEYYRTISRMTRGETQIVNFNNLLSNKSYLIYVIASGVWIVKGLPPLTSIMPDIDVK